MGKEETKTEKKDATKEEDKKNKEVKEEELVRI